MIIIKDTIVHKSKWIDRQSDHYYAIYLLTEHCMPVLLHLKPSNAITVYKKKLVNQDKLIECITREVSDFGCKLTVLYENNAIFFLLIYNRDLLEWVLSDETNYEFLRNQGYPAIDDMEAANTGNLQSVNKIMVISVEDYIEIIKNRYYGYKERRAPFPHEIGILLGYPLKDVMGFVENKGRGYLLQGPWKVYGDVEQAKETFDLFHRARDLGRSIFLARDYTL